MASILSPLLAADHDPDKLLFPYYGSYKLDGYRAFNYEGKLLTRSGKLVQNAYIQELFGRPEYAGFDGELIVGPWNLKETFNNTSGPVRKRTGEPDVVWHLFDDRTSPADPFKARQERLMERAIRADARSFLNVLDQVPLHDAAELEAFEAAALDNCFEGVMLRDPNGIYKFGRSTINENILLKVKRFITEEAMITGLEEQMSNTNPAFLDEQGFTKRSEAREGLVGSGLVGSFWVKSDKWPRPFKISAGSLSHEEKRAAMLNPDKYMYQLARFSYFPHGVKDVPRHGLFDGLRDPNDT